MPNGAEQVTAIATAIGAIGLLSAIGAAIFAGRQVQEARIGRQAEIAAEFFRRWSDDDMVATRRLVASYDTPEALREAFVRHMNANDSEAYIMLRELDYFEQLGALEDDRDDGWSRDVSPVRPARSQDGGRAPARRRGGRSNGPVTQNAGARRQSWLHSSPAASEGQERSACNERTAKDDLREGPRPSERQRTRRSRRCRRAPTLTDRRCASGGRDRAGRPGDRCRRRR